MINIKVIIELLIVLVYKVIDFIKSWFVKRKASAGSNKEEKKPIMTFDDIVCDEDIVDYIKQTRNENIEVDTEEIFKEELEIARKQSIAYEFSNGTVILLFGPDTSVIETYQMVYVEENIATEYVFVGTRVFGICNIRIRNIKLEVICSHTLQYIDSDRNEGFIEVNPLLLAKGRNLQPRVMKWVIARHADVKWYTYDIDEKKDCFITTSVTLPIIAVVKDGKRNYATTIAILVSILPSKNFVYSGTLMDVGGKPYIVSAIVKNKVTGVVRVVAVAPLCHNYDIRYRTLK
jgi:hypothetical protein